MIPVEFLEADSAKLRSFGLVMMVPLGLIGLYLWWTGSPAGVYWLGAAGAFGLLGLVLPIVLKPIYIVWMTFAYFLSIVMTHVLLTLFFYLIMGPAGLIMRLLGKDLLNRKFPGDTDTYWVDAETYPNEIERYSKPY